MLERRIERARDAVELERIVDRQTLLGMQRAIEQVYVSESIRYYIVDLVAATRRAAGRGRREPARLAALHMLRAAAPRSTDATS